ncbi:K2P18.1 potassium channel, partial [Triplophysa rosa]
SVALEEGEKSNPKGNCARWIWRLFPHVFLILSLMAFAALGALIFERIEKRESYDESKEIQRVVRKVVETVQNHTGNSTEPVMNEIQEILDELTKLKEKNIQTWDFYGSLFFCCTVFTTIGYGQMYPITKPGKVACILYAMVGIPLMLLVISDVGDILAVLLSKAYARLSLILRRMRQNRSWSLQREGKTPPSIQVQNVDGTYTFKQNVVVHDTLAIQQVMRPERPLKRNSLQHHNNKEIFDRIIIKENFKFKGDLTKSSSCPELDRMPPTQQDFQLFTNIGQQMDHFNVPLLVILLMVFGYMLICSQILRLWEIAMNPFDAFYFTFITLTTIGFGDILPYHPKNFMVTFLFIIMGMAVMSMAFKLGQSKIVCCYRRFIKCLMGKVGMEKDQHSKRG